MPDVIVAAGVFGLRFIRVLRWIAEPIQGPVVQAMAVRVTSGEIKPVGEPLSQGHLQAVVAGEGIIKYLVDKLQVGEPTSVWCDAGGV